jgi:hypothetical protein
MDTPLVSSFWQDLNNFTRIASVVAAPARQLLRTIDVQPLSAIRDHSGESQIKPSGVHRGAHQLPP